MFFVPPAARWSELQKHARQPDIGTRVDQAMEAIEKDNSTLRGVLPKDFARPQLDKRRLGELVDLFAGVTLYDKNTRAKDLLGRVYEYFLKQFASAEGRLGGDFYTPQSVVRTLVELIEPTRGRVYDPCCGSGGMFVQSERFVEAHGGKRTDISIYGQEWNATTWRLAKMNLAIRGISAHLGERWGDSFHDDKHGELRADYALANPPFNISDWGGERLPTMPAGPSARRRRATPTTPGCSTSSGTSASAASRAWSSQTARCPRSKTTKARSARAWSKRTWSTAWWPCRGSSSTRRRSRCACGSSRRASA